MPELRRGAFGAAWCAQRARRRAGACRGWAGGGQEHAGVAPRAGAASLSGEGSRARAQVVPLVEAGQAAGDEAGAGVAIRAKGAPWHFKLLVVGVAGYMVYRIIWFIEWLPKHI